MSSPVRDIEARLRECVCRVCVSQLADGTCGMPADARCPIFARLPELITVVRKINSESIDPYIAAVRDTVCGHCQLGTPEHCDRRNHLECALDMYLPLIVQVIEEELTIARRRAGALSSRQVRS